MGEVPELAEVVALRELLPREIDEQMEVQQGLHPYETLRQHVRSRIAGSRR